MGGNSTGRRRRFGSVRKLPSGNWQVRYPPGRYPAVRRADLSEQDGSERATRRHRGRGPPGRVDRPGRRPNLAGRVRGTVDRRARPGSPDARAVRRVPPQPHRAHPGTGHDRRPHRTPRPGMAQRVTSGRDRRGDDRPFLLAPPRGAQHRGRRRDPAPQPVPDHRGGPVGDAGASHRDADGGSRSPQESSGGTDCWCCWPHSVSSGSASWSRSAART